MNPLAKKERKPTKGISTKLTKITGRRPIFSDNIAHGSRLSDRPSVEDANNQFALVAVTTKASAKTGNMGWNRYRLQNTRKEPKERAKAALR